MKSSRVCLSLLAAAVLSAANANADRIDMSDPRRALARQDDVRIDAQLLQDNVSSNCTLTITYQVQNFSESSIAIADEVSDVSFDRDSRIITVGFGSEVPSNGMMPKMIVVGPGEKKTFSRGANVHILSPSVRSPFIAVPQAIQVKVSVLRDLNDFRGLIQEQAKSYAPRPLSDKQFDSWLESNDTILLNEIPIRWNPRSSSPEEAKMSKLGSF